MTALIFSVLLLAYVIVPGIVFRRIFHVFVPLRRIQWSRTDELTAFVMTIIVPALAAFLIVIYTQYFGHHPFGFDDSIVLKWNDYKDILSASYSEKFFDGHRLELIAAVEIACRRQCHFLAWYYVATVLWASLCGLLAFYYGNIRNYDWRVSKWCAVFLEKFAIWVISEWHAMFTPFTFSRSPKRWVQVDALSTDGVLYQGEVGIFHVGNDGQLSGFFLKNAKRFLRAEFGEAKKADKATSKDKYWRTIPGESFFLPADKVANFNFTYIPEEPLDTLAEENLKKMKIDATVTIQPVTITVEPSQTTKTDQLTDTAKIRETPQDIRLEDRQQLGDQRNFTVCRHCILNGKPGRLPRISADTPVVSRSDGRSYHLYLQLGPRLQPSPTGANLSGKYLAHFRYSLDSQKKNNEPVTVLIKAKFQTPSRVLELVEKFADTIARELEEGKAPARFYKSDSKGNFSELVYRRD